MRDELWVGALAAAAAVVVATEGDVRACGGCFIRQATQNGTVVTDHRMIFAVSQTQTTLYDQIEYQGAPDSFAWVLPIHAPVTVGLSADTLFKALENATATTIVAPAQTPCPSCGRGFSGAANAPSASAADAGAAVTILNQAVVGPYATVQLSSSDPNALDAWLSANGYSVPANVAPVIAAYVKEGFDFLALKLVPGAGVSLMRPISVTSPGAGLSLPLRMVAAGTGATVGITLWVVGDGRYEPKNFLQFVISPSELVWNFDVNVNQSNYTTLRAQRETGLNNSAWQIESSLSVSPYAIESAVLADPSAGGYEAIPASDAGAADGGPIAAQSAAQVRTQDLETLFASGGGMTRITRMRADLSQSALATDLILQAAHDQSTMSNIYQVTRSVNVPVCAPVNATTCGGSNGGSGGALSDPGNGGSSGGGFVGGTSSGTTGGSSGSSGTGGTGGAGGVAAGNGTTGRTTSGCAVGPAGAGGLDMDLTIAGLVGIALVRTGRTRKTRRAIHTARKV